MKFLIHSLSVLLLVSVFGISHAAINVDSQVAGTLEEWGGVGLTGWIVDEEARVCTIGVAGERILGSGEPLTIDGNSRHHIGSIVKSMTSSLMAILIEQGYFPNGGWDTTLKQIIPSAVNGTFGDVTLSQLAGHISGMANLPPNLDPKLLLPVDVSMWRSVRQELALEAVLSDPETPPGTDFAYSNWGYMTLIYIIEQTVDMMWEEALAQYLFQPLGIDLGDEIFNYIGVPNNEYDPWGHYDLVPCNPSLLTCDTPTWAGSFSGPVAAMATYFSWHVACHNGKHTTVLSQEACQELHTPVNRTLEDYAYGWGCATINGEYICTHNGTNFWNYYNVTLAFDKGRVFAAFTNAGSRSEWPDEGMVDQLVEDMMTSYEHSDEDCAARLNSSIYMELPSDYPPSVAPSLIPMMPTISMPTISSSAPATTVATGATAVAAILMLANAFII